MCDIEKISSFIDCVYECYRSAQMCEVFSVEFIVYNVYCIRTTILWVSKSKFAKL